MPTMQTCKYVNAHINRNTPSLARVQRSQSSLLAGCDYILERGNVLRLRWVVVGADVSALALPPLPHARSSLLGESLVLAV